MKKKLVGLLFGALGLMFVACGQQDVDVDVAEPTESEEEIYHGMDMSVPWVDSDKTRVYEATGFDLMAPAGATNVAYSYMPSTGMAQLNYNLENAMWVYRMKPADSLEDISEINCEWNYIGEDKVAGMDAIEYGYVSEQQGDFIDDLDYVRVVNWFDAKNKVTYSLAVLGKNLDGMDTVVYAENLFNLQIVDGPESDGIAPIDEETASELFETDLYKSYLGLHVNTNDGSEILVEEGGENGKLVVNVSIFRLCSLDDGVGIYENGEVSFSAKDPNGNLIRCVLYYNSDNSLCLEIEESTWGYLPVGTIIDGFDD